MCHWTLSRVYTYISWNVIKADEKKQERNLQWCKTKGSNYDFPMFPNFLFFFNIVKFCDPIPPKKHDCVHRIFKTIVSQINSGFNKPWEFFQMNTKLLVICPWDPVIIWRTQTSFCFGYSVQYIHSVQTVRVSHNLNSRLADLKKEAY